MDYDRYSKLLTKLDDEIVTLRKFSPNSSSPSESIGLIKPDTDFTAMKSEELVLAHTLLHMFYSNNSGKGLDRRTIEKLHAKLVQVYPSHQKFDRLDEVHKYD